MLRSDKIAEIMQCDNIGAGKILSLHWLDCTREALTFNELRD
jgi:hypothetical protein